MKKIISIAIIAIIVIAAVAIGPKVVHTCDDCQETFFGAGYEPNAVSDFLSDDVQIICEDCAMEQHAVAIKFGKSLEEYKYDLF